MHNIVNKEGDWLIKQVDQDNSFITNDLVKMLTNKWGKISIDGFASYTNKKTQRFNSKYICPGNEGVKAFSVDWSIENNFIASPVYLVPKTIIYVIKIFSKGNTGLSILAFFNILSTVIKAEREFQSFIKVVFVMEDVRKYIKLGNYKQSLICSDQFQESFIAFQPSKYFSLFSDIILKEIVRKFEKVNRSFNLFKPLLSKVLKKARENSITKTYSSYFEK